MKLPKIIASYVEAQNANNPEAVVTCFAENATVLDEGKTLTGRESIRRWFIETKESTSFSTEPLSFTERADKAVLKAKVAGNFPGSPVELSYHLTLENGLISDLKIA